MPGELMDEKSTDDVFLNDQEKEQKPRRRNRVNSVKGSYAPQISFEEQSSSESIQSDFSDELFTGKKLVLMKTNCQLKELQTIIWDKNASRADFVFHADRLIRLVIEEGLNQLPFEEVTVTTHSDAEYKGCKFFKGICGVSIVRSGEAMEKGLRECCRSIRIGKILMKKDEESGERKIIYNRFPPDIHERKILLMYPLLLTGGNVTTGVDALLDFGVEEENIYILTLFATLKGIKSLFKRHPNVLLLTTEIRAEVPSHFGEKYFGTDF